LVLGASNGVETSSRVDKNASGLHGLDTWGSRRRALLKI
jgi:hypothetical protein